MSGPIGPSLSLTAREIWTPILIIATIGLVVIGGSAWLIHMQDKRMEEICAHGNHKYQVGQIVRSRIARFRGVILSKSCGGYVVRFNVASMDPQDMQEAELELAK